MPDTDKQSDPCKVMLKDVRLSYPALWKPKGFGAKQEGEPAYQASFLIPDDTKLGKQMIAAVDDAIDAAKEKKWGDKQPKLKGDKICFREGDRDDGDEFDGMMILSARNYKKPRVLDRDKLDVQDGDDGAPYAGCYVDAIVRIWAQDNDYGKRINCSLEAVRFRRDGEAFGAAPVNPDEFEDIEGESRRSRRSRDEEEDKPRSRRSRDDEEEGKSRRSRDDEEEGKSRRSRDDEEEKPRSRRSRDDEEDEKPRSRRSRDDEEEKPRSRRSRDDEEEDKPRSRRRDRDDEI